MLLPKNIKLLIGTIALCEAVGLIGSIFTVPAIPTWYATLVKPSFAPPNYLFGPVWTTLYALMGISVYLVISNKRQETSDKKQVTKIKAVNIFAAQLTLNAIWSPVFFGLKDLLFALVIIIALLFSIFLTIREFGKINKTAGYLLYPYLVWVAFATILNYQLWILNK